MLTFATCKVGGIRFVRIGRLAISICIVRREHPQRRPRASREATPTTITAVPGSDYVVIRTRPEAPL
jgi:hypothetical protein